MPKFLLIMICIISTNVAIVQTPESSASERQKILEKVSEHLDSGDSFATADIVESDGEPLDIAERYSNLVRDLYGVKKNVPQMIMIGRAGVNYCLSYGKIAAEKGDRKLASGLKSFAKEMSYNLSVNCWPAWSDEGVFISESDEVFGLDSARLNYRLAIELKKGDDKVAAAHWLLGAHYLALNHLEDTIGQFQKAAIFYQRAKQVEGQQMALSYIALTKLCKSNRSEFAQQQFDDAVAALKILGTDDAKFYAADLESANDYFMQLYLPIP